MKRILILALAIAFLVPNAYAKGSKDKLMFSVGYGLSQSSKLGTGHEITFGIHKFGIFNEVDDYFIQLRYARYGDNRLYGLFDTYNKHFDDPNVIIVSLEGSGIDVIHEYGITFGGPISRSHGKKRIYWLFDFSVGVPRGTHVDIPRIYGIGPETGLMLSGGTGPMFRIQLVKGRLVLSGKAIGGLGTLKINEYQHGFRETYLFGKGGISIEYLF